MTPTFVGIVGIVALFVLLAIRIPVGIVMMMIGAVGIGVLNGWPAAMATLGSEPFVIASNFELMIIPLFVLMGNLASISGMSRDLYGAAYAWFGHWRGGLASATIAACAGFAALSGSSVASAVTMGRVALPEMRRYDYDPRLALNALRTFAAVYETGGVRPASRALNVAHSSVSRHLRELEKALGIDLFEPREGTRALTFTPQGETLGRAALESFGRLAAVVRSLREAPRRNAVTISTTPSIAALWLLPRLPSFEKAYPGIGLSVIAEQKLVYGDTF